MKSEVFSKNLYRYRVGKKMTQRIVADKIGVRQQTVAAWEANRSTPAPYIICDLAAIFDITTDELLLEEETLNENWPQSRLSVPVLKNTLQDTKYPFAKDNTEEYIHYLGDPTKKYFAIVMEDESMDPVLRVGDIIIAEQGNTLKDGSICVVLTPDSQILVRKIYLQSNGVLMVPANAETVAPIFADNKAFDENYKILGCVAELIRKF